MSSPLTFRNLETKADAILKSDKAKLQWAKLPISDLPKDIAQLALQAIEIEVAAREAKATLQAALDDKVVAPTGKRLVVTLGRDVGPNTDSVLIAWANATSGQTKVITFEQFTKG